MAKAPTTPREMTYGEDPNEVMRSKMQRAESVMILVEDITGPVGPTRSGLVDALSGSLPRTRGLIKKFGARRAIDTRERVA